MVDIANKMNSSTTMNTSSGQIISSESPVMSPGVREAMDLIFPKSSTQLLQRGISFENLGVKENIKNMHPITAAALSSHVSTGALPCSISSVHFTTNTTSNTVMTTSTEVTSSYGNGSSVVSIFPFVTTYCSQSTFPPYKIKNVNKKSGFRSKNMYVELHDKALENIRMPQADSRNHAVEGEPVWKTSGRLNSFDLSSSDCYSKDNSEDIQRPFASIAKEKGKNKKSKSYSEISFKKSGKHLQASSQSGIESGEFCMRPVGSSAVSLKDLDNNIQQQPIQHSRKELASCDYFIAKNNSYLNNQDGHVQDHVFKNGSLFTDFYHSRIITENISNISLSSTKENLQNERRKSKQKLPKVNCSYYHTEKHKDKIRNTFLPCCVVVKKVSSLALYNHRIDLCVSDSVLPLSDRLKHLSQLCNKGFLNCKHKKAPVVEELVYKNIFEETVLPEVYDSELDGSRAKRSLRKRDKHISYVEPSEDDILDEYSRKRSHTKHKDSTGRSEDECSGDGKKRKKETSSDSKTVVSNSMTSVVCKDSISSVTCNSSISSVTCNSSISSVTCNNNISSVICNDSNDKTKAMVRNKKSNEVIVYPPAGYIVKNSCCIRVDGKDGLTSNVSEKSKCAPYSIQNDRPSVSIQPSSRNISVISHKPLLENFNHRNPMILPSLPPGGLPDKAVFTSSPRSAASEAKKPPQFCVVKMDGKDVLLQLVPSSGVSVPGPMVGSKIHPIPIIPGRYEQQPRPAHSTVLSSTQAVPSTSSSIVTASHLGPVPSAPAVPLQPLFGLPVMNTSSHNASLASLPVVPAAQLSGFANTASIRPLNLTSMAYISPNSIAGLSSPVYQMSSENSRIPSAGASTTLSTVSTQSSLSTAVTSVTSMAAPNTTTVVRNIRALGPNLRAVVPNQSTSLHSVRIFVPGCTALGTPGHFATIGSIANNSPLTHLSASSALLPQRKHNDQQLSPEQREARRRKLEKKYPLPPGVVIKTEPLDTVPKPSATITSVSGSRSLLSQNVHLVSASRPGTSFQSIRIINSTLPNAMSVRNVRGNSNIIYRATSIGGGQTVLVPTSFGQISTRSTTAIASTSLTSSASSIISSLAASLQPSKITNTTCVSNASDITTVVLPSFKLPSEISTPPSCSSLSSCINNSKQISSMTMSDSGSTADLMSTSALSIQTSVITSYDSSIRNNTVTTLTTAHCKTSSSTEVVADITPNNNPELTDTTSETATLITMRTGLEELRKMIQVQQIRGLKGERMEKLKELLRTKEEQYIALQNQTSTRSALVNGDVAEVEVGDNATVVGGSELDPFVID